MGENLLTAKQVAGRLQVSERTVRKWAVAGRVPCVRPTAKVLRFDWQAVRSALGMEK